MNTLNFNDADLKANREGRLSDAQQKRLDSDIAMIQGYSKYMLVMMVVIFTLIGIGMTIKVYSDAGQEQLLLFKSDTLFSFAAVCGIFILMIVSIVGWNWWSTRGLKHGRIHAVEGTADIISTFAYVRGMRVPLNRLCLKRNWYSQFAFHFADAQSLRYFKNGTRYRVYYLPNAIPQTLSAEEVESDKAKR